MSDATFDLIVSGSGPSGGTVATKAAESEYRVAIIESHEFGGTCALRGCNPKKLYVNAGRMIDEVLRSTGQLVDGSVQIDWGQLHDFKNEFTDPVARESEESFQGKGIEAMCGGARFTSPSELEINGKYLHAKRFCIATGAEPAPLSFQGSEFVTRSDAFFDLDAMPSRVAFVGGGYISMEFAHVVARFGSQVVIVQRNERVLEGFDPDLFDPDLVELLTEYSRDCGIEFRLGCEVENVENLELLKVTLSDGSSIDCDLIVHGAGRVPSLGNLSLEAADVKLSEQGVAVNQFLQSVTNDCVFATGDCADGGKPQLTPVANEQARIVAKNLFADNLHVTPDYGVVPKVAFTTPSIASVGMSEAEADESARSVDVRFDDASSWGSVRKTGRTVAAYKVIIDKDTDEILGTHPLGPSAEETINLFAMAMKHGLTATDIKSTLFAFPTFASDVRRMV